MGALDESALYIAASDDKDAAMSEVVVVMDRIVDAFAIPQAARPDQHR